MAKRKRAVTTTVEPSPYRVFVSHATYDKWIATVMCEKLEAAGIETFRDDRDIEGGGDILHDRVRLGHLLSIHLLLPVLHHHRWQMVVLQVVLHML